MRDLVERRSAYGKRILDNSERTKNLDQLQEFDGSKYKQLLDQARLLPPRPQREKTIFSIGGRGHYENPISDVLAFFLDPRECHQLGDLCLRSLFECLKEKNKISEIPSLELDSAPIREQETAERKRPDIIVVGTHWVLAIENKIRADLTNPTDIYKGHVKHMYSGRQPLFVLLKPSTEPAPDPQWTVVTYKDFLEKLKILLAVELIKRPYTKWIPFLRDFVLNLEQEVGGGFEMEKKRLVFAQSHLGQIYELQAIKDEYFDYIKNSCMSIMRDEKATDEATAPHRSKWSFPDPVLKFESIRWSPGSDITVGFLPQGDAFINIYVAGLNTEEDELKADTWFSDDHFTSREWEPRSTKKYRVYWGYQSQDPQKLLDEFRKVVRKMNEYFTRS
jgi:hypothetical protein